jgi:ABC-type antimicrobial peptide transport system permease subunit
MSKVLTYYALDAIDAPPTVVISQSMASRYWPAGDALGARIRMGPNPASPLVSVVGIVGDVRNDPARQDAEPMAYRSSRQASPAFARVLLRTHDSPLALVKPVERELAALNRGVPLEQPMTLDREIGDGLAARRLPVMLIAIFAGLALLLASVGIYAMFSSMGVARQQEFGIRVALGSRPHAIAGLMLRQGAGWMAGGLAGGAFGIVLVVRLLRGLLYDVPPFDPIALGSAIAILLACAALALLIPVRHATRVDPIAMLRAE